MRQNRSTQIEPARKMRSVSHRRKVILEPSTARTGQLAHGRVDWGQAEDEHQRKGQVLRVAQGSVHCSTMGILTIKRQRSGPFENRCEELAGL